MQVLKEQVRRRIVSSAQAEFLKKGYGQASMRIVAESSEITVGNIYRYFSSKQSLFEDVVSPAYQVLKSLLESVQIHEEMPLPSEDYIRFREQFVREIATAIEAYRDEILILFNGSEGTVFSDAMNELSGIIFSVLEKYVLETIASRNSVQNLKALGRLISKGIVEAIKDLVARTVIFERDAVENELRMIIDFYFRDLVTRFD
ncbi:TetR/AcrR family transcriptional regulator [Acidaminobacter sp.]|uniref:TetR/AcrR family transcriptional regulator n=1 Tax=Acidaminobacter sp. TaxID=1872102 RepID=UPI0025602D19|nr:TetR/AcrR family transcriptional regulator [Acidaminobacter sp.]MDK9709692.1 TetR/AcrR family transcriptional regulator [Acidaminobacter sp.]